MDEQAIVGEQPQAESTRRRRSHHKQKPTQVDPELTVLGDAGSGPGGEGERKRRSKKLTGLQVSKAIEHGSNLIVSVTRQSHWHIPAEETKTWTPELAELLNGIPVAYVEGIAKFSGLLTIGFGIYATLAPRVVASQYIAEQARQAARDAASRRAAQQNGTVPPEPQPAYSTVDDLLGAAA